MYTANFWDFVRADTSGGSFNVNLPPSTGGVGERVSVKKVTLDGNTVTVVPSGIELIDGQTSQAVQFPYSNLEMQAYNGGWDIV